MKLCPFLRFYDFVDRCLCLLEDCSGINISRVGIRNKLCCVAVLIVQCRTYFPEVNCYLFLTLVSREMNDSFFFSGCIALIFLVSIVNKLELYRLFTQVLHHEDFCLQLFCFVFFSGPPHPQSFPSTIVQC